MNSEFVLQSIFSLILPTIYLFMVSTYIFTRSYHVYIGKMVALMLICSAFAYLFDYIRLLAPVEYSHFLHFTTLSFMSLCFSLIVHMLYNIIQKNTGTRIPLLPYALYLYTIAMPLYGLLEHFIIGHPGYYKEDGWIYRGGSGIVMFNLYFSFVMYAINLYLLAFGIKHAKTEKFKKFFTITFLFTVFCIGGILIWHAGMKQFHSITPPTSSLLFLLWTGTFYALLITKLGFIPSVVKRYSSLLESSPTPIVYLNEKWRITEANSAAIRQFHMQKNHFFTSFFNLDTHPEKMTKLSQLLEENNYIKGFEIHYFEQEQERYVLIDASKVYIGEETFYYFLIHDVTIEYQQAKLSQYLAYHDPLTTIHNRAYFERHVKKSLSTLSPSSESVLVLSDLNFFKSINDTYGHQIGDEVLIFTAKSLQQYLPKPYELARLGGDEFIMFFENITSRQAFEEAFAIVRQRFQQNWFTQDALHIEVVPSFGMAYTSETGTDYSTLYNACDMAMYTDKKEIKHAYQKTNQNHPYN